MEDRPILVTGGAGFIGSNFVLEWLAQERAPVVNLDKLTYAGNLSSLEAARGNGRHAFVRGDIADDGTVGEIFARHRPRAVVNFAAESHVDRSIHGPAEFVRTNVVGTCVLLEGARSYWTALPDAGRRAFRFLHVSTDEVYGSLGPADPAFTETTRYAPNSPYAASKAASDHFVRAYHHTYGLPTLITNCSNNYGPRQFPEKLIPLMILNAVRGEPLPVYGDGLNVRDWLYVSDHCAALRTILAHGAAGEVYNVGGGAERTNREVVRGVCSILDELRPDGAPHERLVRHVTDRPGHDRRYAMDSGKLAAALGWRPTERFESGLRKTVVWYLENGNWVEGIMTGSYRRWMELNYGSR